jgi:hypothetical protein
MSTPKTRHTLLILPHIEVSYTLASGFLAGQEAYMNIGILVGVVEVENLQSRSHETMVEKHSQILCPHAPVRLELEQASRRGCIGRTSCLDAEPKPNKQMHEVFNAFALSCMHCL